MARTRINGKEVDFHKREDYKIRKRQSRIRRKNKDGALLNRLQLELRNRTIKQTRRWIKHVTESPDRGGMSWEIEQELLAYSSKLLAQQLEQTKLSLKPALSRQADDFWRALQAQRKAAMTGQGQPFEAVDWWVPKSGANDNGEEARKEKLRKAIQNLNARMKELGEEGEMGQMEGLGVDGEEDEPAPDVSGPPEPVTAGDDKPDEHEDEGKDKDEDEDEGGVHLAGSHSPIMLSPVLSPALEEEELPAFGPSRDLVLPFRSRLGNRQSSS